MKKLILMLFIGITYLHSATGYTLTVESLNVNEGVGIAQVNIRVTPKNKNTWDVGDQIIVSYSTSNANFGSLATENVDYVASSNTTIDIKTYLYY